MSPVLNQGTVEGEDMEDEYTRGELSFTEAGMVKVVVEGAVGVKVGQMAKAVVATLLILVIIPWKNVKVLARHSTLELMKRALLKNQRMEQQGREEE